MKSSYPMPPTNWHDRAMSFIMYMTVIGVVWVLGVLFMNIARQEHPAGPPVVFSVMCRDPQVSAIISGHLVDVSNGHLVILRDGEKVGVFPDDCSATTERIPAGVTR